VTDGFGVLKAVPALAILTAYPGERLLSIGCWSDRRHGWQTWNI